MDARTTHPEHPRQAMRTNRQFNREVASVVAFF